MDDLRWTYGVQEDGSRFALVEGPEGISLGRARGVRPAAAKRRSQADALAGLAFIAEHDQNDPLIVERLPSIDGREITAVIWRGVSAWTGVALVDGHALLPEPGVVFLGASTLRSHLQLLLARAGIDVPGLGGDQ